jgi:hypothetical protein
MCAIIVLRLSPRAGGPKKIWEFMVWRWFYRIAVDDTGTLYEYGYENKTPTGEIEYIVSVHKVGYFVDRPCIFSPKGCENAVFKEVCP